MYHNLEVTNLKERKIIYKNARKLRIRSMALMISILVLPLSLILGFSIADYASFKDTIAVISNPIYPPYSETGNIIFTNGQAYFIEDKEEMEFVVPVKSYEAEIDKNSITFTVYSNGIVNASEDGIVTDSGTNSDGVKFIEITHANDIVTTYLNLETIGVNSGDGVAKGKEIATLNLESKLVLTITKEGKEVENIEIQDNIILWQN